MAGIVCKMKTIKGRKRLGIAILIVMITVSVTNLLSTAFRIDPHIKLWIVGVIFLGVVLVARPLIYSVIVYLVEAIIILSFPINCGSRKFVFTGKSSRNLKDILLTIDSEVQAEEEFIEAENLASQFLNNLKTELENKITPTTTFEYFLAGSVAERYGIPYSFMKSKISAFISALRTDFDFMFCSNSMEASFDGSTGIRIDPLLNPGGFTGFVQLKSLATNSIVSSKDILKEIARAIDDTSALNITFKGSLVTMVRGPAIKIEIPLKYEADITLCIKCRDWPTRSDWLTRQRSWPSPEDVRRIVSLGCHLVPKPAPSDKQQTSWRFSFSVAEVELSKLVPKTARKCFLALKIILKDHLQPVFRISSYHMKTILFNTLEKTPTDLWVDEKIEQCFFVLLKELYDALRHGRLRHHWFSDINLFDWDDKRANCIFKAEFKALTKKVQRIGENPAPFIFDDGEWYLFPCCTRLRLYDFPGDIDVQQVNEPVDDSTNQDACCTNPFIRT